MGSLNATGSKSKRHVDRKKRAACAIEQLEPLIMMSADLSYEAWRQQTFSIGSTMQFTVDSYYIDSVHGLMSQALSLVGADRVQSNFGYTGTGYTVAIIDTGVDYTHSALAAAYLGGYDFVDDDYDPMDMNGHGTHVAGIVASRHATNRGIAPNVNFVALRVLDANGNGSFGDVEAALQWVINHRHVYNIVAVNLSLGAGNFTANPYSFMEDELQTLNNQGVFVAAASGNSYFSYGSQQGLGYPAISPLTVSVGAVWDANYGAVSWVSGARDYTTGVDRITSFTQRSSAIDIFAPGAFITSTYVGGGFATLAGTSMAAPVVAGAAVLIRQALEANGLGHLATQSYIVSLMKNTGVSIVDGDDENDNVTNTGLTFKRLDVFAAISSLGGGGGPVDPPETPPPTPNQAYVTSLYQQLLNRTPDAAGLQTFTYLLNSGVSREQLVRYIWNSLEHRTNEAIALYQSLLNRTPGAGEAAALAQQMAMSPRTVDWARQFLTSAEFSSKYVSNSAFIEALYQKTLGRTGDFGGIAMWTSVLNQGVSRAVVVDIFLQTAERAEYLVRTFYNDYLGRTPGQGEVQYWANTVRATRDFQVVAEACLASNEYFQRAAGANSAGSLLAAGAMTVDASQSNAVTVGLWTATSAQQPQLSPQEVDEHIGDKFADVVEDTTVEQPLSEAALACLDDASDWTPAAINLSLPSTSDDDASADDDQRAVFFTGIAVGLEDPWLA